MTHNHGARGCPKWCRSYSMICAEPGKWFRGARIEARDRALLTGTRADFVEYSKGSFVRKIVSASWVHGIRRLDEFTVEEDVNCKQMIQSAGGQLYGFDLQPYRPAQWASMTVNVNIKGATGGDFDWGFLSTGANNIRIFKGPPETCPSHAWDAMILRDCTPNTTSLYNVEHVASRRWDILAMKMCEDFDHPWVVVSVQDAGPAPLASVCNLR